MGEPSISVVIPMYNALPYIKECVDSVLDQTFRDFEIIIVDDCSTDGSLSLCQELYGNLSQVTIRHHERNRTVGAARNTGIRAARGKYIAFLDSDDLFVPDALERFFRAAEMYGADLVHSPECFLPNGSTEHISTEDDFRVLRQDRMPMGQEIEVLSSDPAERTSMLTEKEISIVVWNNLFRRTFLLEHNILFEEDIVPGQDGVFMFRCIFYANPFVRMPRSVCIYRHPQSSVTRTKRDANFLVQLVSCMIRKLESLEEYMKAIPFYRDHPEKREAVRNFAIADTDQYFVQDCYLPDGRVNGDLKPVHEVFQSYFGTKAWFVEYFFHAGHKASTGEVLEWGLRMNYMFPWRLFSMRERVVLYGAGEVGKCFYEQVMRFGYVQLAGIVDRNAGSVGMRGIPVQGIETLETMEFDHILITVINREVAKGIRIDLEKMKIPSSKIIWVGETYPIEEYYKQQYFPNLESRRMILYGAGLNAQEYYRYLERKGEGNRVLCFAVTKKDPYHPENLCGRPLYGISDAVQRFPGAEVRIVLQEKYHDAAWQTLQELGKEADVCIGLRYMTRLLGEEGIRELTKELPGLKVLRKPGDYSMLYLYPKDRPWQIYELYPMTQIPLSTSDVEHLHHAVNGRFFEMFGSYEQQEVTSKRSGDCSLFIAMASSEGDTRVSMPREMPSYLHRVHAGAVRFLGDRTEDEYYDDTGRNISEENIYDSELTVTYWLWKNIDTADYLGLCHYRRHFCLNENALERIYTGSIDILLTRPRLTFPDVKAFLTSSASTMSMEDYDEVLKILRERDPMEAKLAREIGDGQIHFPNNMLIARKEIFCEYSEWMFSILEEVARRKRQRGVLLRPRYAGYIGEFLTTLFIAIHEKKYKIEYIDYELLE